MELKREASTLIHDFIAIFNREGKCINTSNEWNQFFNIEVDPRGKRFKDLINEELKDQFLKHFSRAREHKISTNFTFNTVFVSEPIHAYCLMKPWFLDRETLGGVIVILEFEDQSDIKNSITSSPKISTPKEINKEKTVILWQRNLG